MSDAQRCHEELVSHWSDILSNYEDGNYEGFEAEFIESQLQRASCSPSTSDAAEKLASLSYTAKQLGVIDRMAQDIADGDYLDHVMGKDD